ncbi:MAG TPA: amino acid adenylation domain-containing protein, partial [Thermoanaerobaculia bacterium]
MIDPPAGEAILPIVDLAALGARGGAEALRLLITEGARPFDLGHGPLVRPLLVRRTREEHVLAATLHHAIADGWSLGLLLDELGALYRAFAAGAPDPLPPLPLQYTDYARWERSWSAGSALAAPLAYWRERFAAPPQPLALPADRQRSTASGVRGGEVAFDLPEPLVAALAEHGRRSGATLFMALVAGLAALLSRLSGEEDLAIGTPVAGRLRPELERLIGCFINPLPLRLDLHGAPGFAPLVAHAKAEALAAFAHQEVPFERLVGELAVERDLARSALFSVLLTLQNAPLDPAAAFAGSGLKAAPVAIPAVAGKLDLAVTLAQGALGLAGTLVFRRALFDRTTIERWARSLTALLTAAVAAPDAPFAELPLFADSERHQMLLEWSSEPTDGSADRVATVPERLAAQAAGRREWIAVRAAGSDGGLTYRELDARAERWARRLRVLGIGPEVAVGVYADRSPELVVALLAIWKAGGAFLPLDPAHPPARSKFMLDEAAAPLVLSVERGGLAERAREISGGRTCVVALDVEPERESAGTAPRPRPDAAPDADSLAYVLYTSGSTGRPKGVLVPHGGLAAYLGWAVEAYGAGAGSGTLVHTSISFDLTLTSLFVPLLLGETAVMVEESAGDEALAAALSVERDLRFVKLTPSHARLIGEQVALRGDRAALDAAHGLILGGEALAPQDVAPWREASGETVVWNEYGPTETVVGCTLHAAAARELHGPAVPIGRPVAGARIYVLDRSLRPVPIGVAGELFVGGPGVARGYLARPDATAERFLPDPWGAPGARLYRTGDRGRCRADGTLEALGRLDQQVKVRGHRIEPGEVEAALAAHEAVREAAVLAVAEAGGWTLAAFVAAPDTVGARELRAFLRARLPEPLVPASFTILATLPRTTSGKLDRRALASLAAERRPSASAAERPRGLHEETLAAIWAEVLRFASGALPARDDDFFDLGGHSLLATQVVSRVRDAFGVELPVRALFEAPTIASLAARIEASGASGAEVGPPLTARPRTGPLPLSFAQQRLWFLDQLEPASATYNLPVAVRLAGSLDRAALAAACAGVVSRHEALRTTFGLAADGQPEQRIAPGANVPPLPLVDLSALPRPDAEEARLTAALARLPFDLARGPLFRPVLLAAGPAEHTLVAAMHHIVSDGWSMGILVREVA